MVMNHPFLSFPLSELQKRELRHRLIRSHPTSFQQLSAAAAWAAIREQCEENYSRLREQHKERYGNGLHIRTLVFELQLELEAARPGMIPSDGGIAYDGHKPQPTTIQFMLWVLNNQCRETFPHAEHDEPLPYAITKTDRAVTQEVSQ